MISLNNSGGGASREIVLRMKLEDDRRNASTVKAISDRVVAAQDRVQQAVEKQQLGIKKLLDDHDRITQRNMLGFKRIGDTLQRETTKQEAMQNRQIQGWQRVGQALEKQQQQQEQIWQRQTQGWQRVANSVQRDQERIAQAAERTAKREARAQEMALKRVAVAHERSLRVVERERRQAVTGALDVAEGGMRVARGVGMLGLMDDDTTQSMLQGLLMVQGTYDIAKGGVKMTRGVRNAARGYIGSRRAAAAADFIGPLTPAQQAAGMSYFDGHPYWKTATPGVGGFVNNLAGGVGNAVTAGAGALAAKAGITAVGGSAAAVAAAAAAAAASVGIAGKMIYETVTGRANKIGSTTMWAAEKQVGAFDWVTGKLGLDWGGSGRRRRQSERIASLGDPSSDYNIQERNWREHLAEQKQLDAERRHREIVEREAAKQRDLARLSRQYQSRGVSMQASLDYMGYSARAGKTGLDADLAQSQTQASMLRTSLQTGLPGGAGTGERGMFYDERSSNLRALIDKEEELYQIRLRQKDVARQESEERLRGLMQQQSLLKGETQGFQSATMGYYEASLRNPEMLREATSLNAKAQAGSLTPSEALRVRTLGLERINPELTPLVDKSITEGVAELPGGLRFQQELVNPRAALLENRQREVNLKIETEQKIQMELNADAEALSKAVHEKIAPLFKELATTIAQGITARENLAEETEQARQAQARAAAGGG